MGGKIPVFPVMTAEAEFRIPIGQQEKIIGWVPMGIVTGGTLHAAIVEGNRRHYGRRIL
jgi:hypothetical protein